MDMHDIIFNRTNPAHIKKLAKKVGGDFSVEVQGTSRVGVLVYNGQHYLTKADNVSEAYDAIFAMRALDTLLSLIMEEP